MEETINKLDELESRRDLTIIKLSDSILASNEDVDEKRASDASSTAGYGMTTPATYEAELSHYKDLFAKLRFQYVEQVTKEKFINTIVGEEPLQVSATQNAELEGHVAAMKIALKAQKVEVEEMAAQLEQQSREVARRHYAVQLQCQELRQLPAEMQQLQTAVSRLRQEQGLDDSDGNATRDANQSLPLARTLELADQRDQELLLLDQQLATLETTSERKARELQKLQDELGTLQTQERQATTAAAEALRRKDEGLGSPDDEIENRGRWLEGVQTTMQALLV